MKKSTLFYLLLCGLLITACKKDPAKQSAPPPSPGTGSGPTPSSFVIDSIQEKNGQEKIFNITVQETVGTSTPTILKTFTCTSTIIGDTMLVNNVPAKKYIFTFNNTDYPSVKAYSYINNSTWFFHPQKFSYFIHDLSIPLPLTQVGQGWNLVTTTLHDTLNVEKTEHVMINDFPTKCYKIYAKPVGLLWYEFFFYNYYIDKKGIEKQLHSYTHTFSADNTKTIVYETNLISSNF
jgi:hypothetical protein